MAATSAREASAAGPWLLRALRLPAWVPILAGASLAGALVALHAALPPPPGIPWSERYGVSRFFVVMLGAYVATAPWLTRSALRTLGRVPGLAPDARRGLERELARAPRAFVACCLAIMALGHVAILVGVGFDFSLVVRSDFLPTRGGFVVVAGWLHVFGLGVWLALVFHQGDVFRRLGGAFDVALDLVDHRRLAPFVEMALRLSLAGVVWTAGAILLHVDWSGDRSVAPQIPVAGPLWAAGAVGLFLFPLWGLHRRLLEARDAELDRVGAAILGNRDALRGSLVARDADRLTTVELLTYRGQVKRFSTWPFDASSLARLAAYLGIPLLGWLGGALVERVVDAALG